MKRLLCLLLAALTVLGLGACGEKSGAPTGETTFPTTASEEPKPLQTLPLETAPSKDTGESAFVDLTALSSTMVYSEVYNMMMTPENYIGNVVRMHGLCSTFESAAVDGQEARVYYTCIIFDATACCSQGIEFVLAGDPGAESYPPVDAEITVTGTFQTYDENGILYCHLVDATLE